MSDVVLVQHDIQQNDTQPNKPYCHTRHERHSALRIECQNFSLLYIVILIVIILNVVILSVVAPVFFGPVLYLRLRSGAYPLSGSLEDSLLG
jgi:hypothetical protein